MMMTPPERANKLTPRWKGPFRVKRVPNPYLVVYEDGSVWRTVDVNHTKPAKLTAPDLPLPTPAPEPPRPQLRYLSRSLQRPCSRPPPPQAAAPTGGTPPPSTASVPTTPAPPPPVRERLTRGAASANRNSAPLPQPPTHPGSKIQPPTSAPANQNSGSASRLQRSARLNPGLGQACCIKGPPGARGPQSQQSDTMAWTYPLTLGFSQCLGAKEEPFVFSSVCVEDLRNGDLEYLSTIRQLVDALPKTEDPASRFALRGHVTPPGHQRLCHSMRAALWWLLPSDGEFRGASHSLHYYLTCQGRRLVLRGGDVTQPTYEMSPNRGSFSCPHIRHFDAVFRSFFSAPKTPAIKEKKKEEGCSRSQSKIQHPARLTSRPRLCGQPIGIQLAGERPSPGQQPMTAQR